MQIISQFIKQQRESKRISLEKLSSGLCHFTYLSKDIERDGNITDKFLIDTLLQRLGVSDDYFEHLVTNNDINIQKIRLDIFENIKSKNYNKIEELIEQYPECKIENIHNQFKEYIKAILLQKQSAPIDEIIDQYLKAIKITLIDFDGKNINDMLLSSVEACIVFEYAILTEKQDSAKGLAIYTQLLRYFNKQDIETGIKCRILPKLIYNMCQIWLKDKKYLPILNLCNIGIECLRVNQKFYYFTKLLELKIEVIEKSKLENEDYEQVKEWYEVLNELYDEYQVNPNDDNIIYMQNFLWQNYDAIGDVIRNRRKILGMTQAQLCDGICDYKTVSRIERLQGNSQLEIVEQLLQRLNLSGQLYSDGVVTNDYETFALAREITHTIIQRKYVEANHKLSILKEKLINQNSKVNSQFLKLNEINISKEINKITIEENLSNLIQTLELTIPIDMLYDSLNIHLSKREINIINNAIKCYNEIGDFHNQDKLIIILQKYFIDKSFNQKHFNVYSFTFLNISSIYGNKNNFIKSNSILNTLLTESFTINYHRFLKNIFYDLLWNSFNNENFVDNKLLKSAYNLSKIHHYEHIINLINEKTQNY